jgi:SAM-dependent methyltransferase
MDELTLGANEQGAACTDDWEDQSVPADMYALIDEFFCPGPTADVGCGSGRDAAWLAAHGFQTTGYDPSPTLLAEARSRHPDVEFALAGLPELEGVPREHFANVLCDTGILQTPPDQVPDAVRTLLAVLAPEGTLYLSWRVAGEAAERAVEPPGGGALGRLDSPLGADVVRAALAGATVLLDEEAASASSGTTIHRLIARKH